LSKAILPQGRHIAKTFNLRAANPESMQDIAVRANAPVHQRMVLPVHSVKLPPSTMATAQQLSLSFHGVRNSGLFSNHWLDHRLVLEPEWQTSQAAANTALDKLTSLWKVQKIRVEHYASEHESPAVSGFHRGLSYLLANISEDESV
jgi:hypothetical protein